jgi:hypothetical protein
MTNARPADSEPVWTTVAEARTKIVFDTDGDVFAGFFDGPEEITNPNTGEVYDYLNFRNDTGAYTVSATYQLGRAFASIPVGTLVRITRLSESPVKTGMMTNFKVEVAR